MHIFFRTMRSWCVGPAVVPTREPWPKLNSQIRLVTPGTVTKQQGIGSVGLSPSTTYFFAFFSWQLTRTLLLIISGGKIKQKSNIKPNVLLWNAGIFFVLVRVQNPDDLQNAWCVSAWMYTVRIRILNPDPDMGVDRASGSVMFFAVS